jgi:hypothetical protein
MQNEIQVDIGVYFKGLSGKFYHWSKILKNEIVNEKLKREDKENEVERTGKN